MKSTIYRGTGADGLSAAESGDLVGTYWSIQRWPAHDYAVESRMRDDHSDAIVIVAEIDWSQIEDLDTTDEPDYDEDGTPAVHNTPDWMADWAAQHGADTITFHDYVPRRTAQIDAIYIASAAAAAAITIIGTETAEHDPEID